jgi:colanic acid biosynthesis glycosyl transferase WcaI
VRIAFVNRYFHPDLSATSQILTELALDLGAMGYEIHVVTSRQLSDDPLARLAARDKVGTVHIHRVSTTRFGRSKLVGRAIDYLTFYVSSFVRLYLLLRPGDIVVAKTDPPMISVVAAIAARLRRASLVNWLQDLFPEVAIRLQVLAEGRLARFATYVRDRSLQQAASNVTIGQKMADMVNLIAPNVEVIPNWADSELVYPVAPDENYLRKDWGLEDKFVVAYSGNLGRAHEFGTILEAMGHFKNDPMVRFLIIGGGKQHDWMRSQIEQRGLREIVQLRPLQPREQLPQSLSVGDVHLVTLLANLEGCIVPSKFYGIAAAGRPTIFIGDWDGEIARTLRKYDCGALVSPGDGPGLAAAIRVMHNDKDRRTIMSKNAREALLHNFDRAKSVERWAGVLQRIERGVAK